MTAAVIYSLPFSRSRDYVSKNRFLDLKIACKDKDK